jgi:hypothetical protein
MTVADLCNDIARAHSRDRHSIVFFFEKNLLLPDVKLSALISCRPSTFVELEGLFIDGDGPVYRPWVTTEIPSLKFFLARIFDEPVHLLIDSGAATSILYMDDVLRIPGLKRHIRRYESDRTIFSSVQGKTNPAVGVIPCVRVDFGEVVTLVKFTVLPGRNAHGLLGMDWMKQNNVIFDALNDSVSLHGKELVLRSTERE